MSESGDTHDARPLLIAAARARDHAHAPYSGFRVGAALLDDAGGIHPGCNVENASYGITICAERVALCRAVADGRRHFVAIAIATDREATPCGACRQALHEFAPSLAVHLGDPHGQLRRSTTLDVLLPDAFGSVGE